jgi:hypothetical protein
MTAQHLDRERLAKLCGMFGSEHPGERANAAAAADKLIRSAGMRWPDIILPALPAPPGTRPVNGVADAIRFVLEHREALSEWELGFAESIRRARYRLSKKQIEILERLVEKARRAEARAA